MRLLLTNDDGFESPGILLLADALRGAGHRVIMVAPDRDNSGISHAITFFKGLHKLAEIGSDSFSFEGTPADCVVIALRGGLPELSMEDGFAPDAVIAGINRGANLGSDLVYSGTAGAARQGAFCGIPSLALSLVQGDEKDWYWDQAVAFTVERLEEMLGYWKPDSFVNVNLPNRPEKPEGLVHSYPAFRHYKDVISVYRAPDGNSYCMASPERVNADWEAGSDCNAVINGSAAISEIFIHPLLIEDVGKRRFTL